MSDRFTPDVSVDSGIAGGLEAWDAEGGAPGSPAQLRENTAASAWAMQRRLLERLGAALVSEWGRLPMPLQRAIYNHAVGGDSAHDAPARKRRLARFLHDHRTRGQPGGPHR